MMTWRSRNSDLVVLKGGLLVPRPALLLLWNLEERGLTIKHGADGVLLVGPQSQLTASDRAEIAKYRDPLARLVDYQAIDRVIA